MPSVEVRPVMMPSNARMYSKRRLAADVVSGRPFPGDTIDADVISAALDLAEDWVRDALGRLMSNYDCQRKLGEINELRRRNTCPSPCAP